jgi:hypothetical protein
MDDPSTLPSGYDFHMPAETLNLIETRVVPHAGTEGARAATALLRARRLRFIELRDGDDALAELP